MTPLGPFRKNGHRFIGITFKLTQVMGHARLHTAWHTCIVFIPVSAMDVEKQESKAPMRVPFATRGSLADVVAGALIGLVFFAVLAWFSFKYNDGKDTAVVVFSAMLGAAFGWVIGLVATPYNQDESRRLSEIAKVTYGFITGYLLSKIDPILTDLFSKAVKDSTERIILITGVGVVGFLVAFGVTFICRSYWHAHR